MSRVFTNSLGDRGSIPGWVISKAQKMVRDAGLLNTQHYKVQIKGKVEQSREECPSLHLSVEAIEKGAFGSLLIMDTILYFQMNMSLSFLWIWKYCILKHNKIWINFLKCFFFKHSMNYVNSYFLVYINLIESWINVEFICYKLQKSVRIIYEMFFQEFHCQKLGICIIHE